jgi:hypothetical protein
MTKPKVFRIVIVLAVLLVFGAVVTQTKLIHRLYDNYVMDNKNHYLPCHKLPGVSEVRQALDVHQDTIRKIEAVNLGLVGVDIDTWTCPGHADVVIWYASRQDRRSIEAILDSAPALGVPYRLNNR